MNIQNYISKLKTRKYTDNIIINNIYQFINTSIDVDGNIYVTDKFYEELKKNIIKIIDTNYESNIQLIDTVYKHKFNYNLNKTVFYSTFFESLAINISGLQISNINYNIISKIIFEIYLYGTTFMNLYDYLNFNINLVNYNKNNIKILNDTISKLDYFNNIFTTNSYKLLILGHLFSFIHDDKKVIMENIALTFARITLEFTKNTIDESLICDIFLDMYNGYYAPSTPMFYNSLMNKNMLTSCFIINVEDNIESIGNFYKKIIKILKHGSGIGVVLNKIRAKNRYVMNKYTKSNGIKYYIDILSLFSQQFKNYIKQRSTNINITLSIDHPDIMDFINLKINTNIKEGLPYNNLFQTISIPDEFMYRLLTKKPWYLISPDQHIDNKYLYDVVGEEYSILYEKMINDNNIEKIMIDPVKLLEAIINARIQTGSPFIFFKDNVNKNSPYKETINGTNLCTEILQDCDEEKTACCNIISINLKTFVNNNVFDYKLYKKKIKNIVYILNNVIDNSYYSDETCKNANNIQRPMAIGIQGLANAFNEMNISYLEGKEEYRKMIEILYYYALKQSCIISKNHQFNLGKNYQFHFDKFYNTQKFKKEKLEKLNLHKLSDIINLNDILPKYTHKWDKLKKNIELYGLYNTLFIAFMPTSFVSGIYNNSDSFEPYMYNIYKKTYTTYDIVYYNTYLIKELENTINYHECKNILSKLLKVNGDISKLNIPYNIKKYLLNKYKTLYDINIDKYTKFNTYIDPYVDQGISYNITLNNNNNIQLTKNLIDLWLLGKKTIYYYRTSIYIEPLVFDKNINKQISNTIFSSEKSSEENCTFCQ